MSLDTYRMTTWHMANPCPDDAPRSLHCFESSYIYIWTIDMTNGEKSVNPLPDGTSSTKQEPEKKKPPGLAK